MQKSKKKEMTIDKLAEIMKKGFDGVDEKFAEVNQQFIGIDEKFDGINQQFAETNTLLKLTRLEMAKDDDVQEVKKIVATLYKMLDDEARFISQMRSEYPIFIKRLERIEKKLGLPHHISED